MYQEPKNDQEKSMWILLKVDFFKIKIVNDKIDSMLFCEPYNVLWIPGETVEGNDFWGTFQQTSIGLNKNLIFPIAKQKLRAIWKLVV